MSETSIQQRTLIELQRAFPDGLFYRRNVGVARDSRSGRVIKFGVRGQADIAGIVDGRAVEIEIKSDTGRQSEAQQNWERAVRRAGGIYLVGRDPLAVIETLRGHLGSRHI